MKKLNDPPMVARLEPRVRVLLFVAAMLVLLAGAVEAQLTVAFDYSGPAAESHCSAAIVSVGDINGDGVADLAVGEPGNWLSYSGPFGRVQLLSGVDGSQIYSVTQFSPVDYFGAAIAATGDLDGDGIPDFAVGAPQADPSRKGAVYGYSGASGTLLYSVFGGATNEQLGSALVAIGDVDGDGVADLIAGTPAASYLVSYGGRAQVISGATGAIIRNHDGTTNSGNLGTRVAAMDDVDGDGVEDYAIAVPDAPSPQGVGTGVVRVYSGATGSLIYVASDPTSSNYVTSMARISDLDGDGIDDLLIANYVDPGNHGTNSNRGSIRVVSGVNGTLLHRIFGFLKNESIGFEIASIADLDGDGFDEILTTTSVQQSIGHPIPSGLRIFSGINGNFLFEQGLQGCKAVCVVPDLDGDGLDEIAMGQPNLNAPLNAPLSDAGRCTVLLSQTVMPNGMGLGQKNRPSAALFVNGVLTYANNGPFAHLIPAGAVLVLDVIGNPYALFDLYASATLSPSAWNFPGFGTLDIGTAPSFTDVNAVVQGLTGGQVLFACNGSGAARLTMAVPPGWPAGLLGCIQGLVQIPQPAPNGPWARLTAAHQIFVQ